MFLVFHEAGNPISPADTPDIDRNGTTIMEAAPPPPDKRLEVMAGIIYGVFMTFDTGLEFDHIIPRDIMPVNLPTIIHLFRRSIQFPSTPILAVKVFSCRSI